MAVETDLVGVVREHRWASIAAQTKRLKEAGCTKVFDLSKVDRQDIERLARPERVLCLLFAFLLARKRKGGMMADFEGCLARIEKRNGSVRDVSTGLTSNGEARASFLAVVKDQARRSQQGLHAAEKGRLKKGRPHEDYSAQQYADAKAIWRDRVEYPDERRDAKPALAAIQSTSGTPFSVARARRKWGKRHG